MIGRTLGAAAAAAALVAGSAADAAPACWHAAEAQAAHVRRMQTMLMVATLRCRAAHIDIVADYDGFVRGQAAAIAAANLRIKQHFADTGGAQADYDRFATSLANGFGDGETSEASCADAAALAREASVAADASALDAVATARLFPAALAGGLCERPALTPARETVAIVTPPPPGPEPVALPAEVVAALTVMARFRDAERDAPSAPTQVATIAR